MVRMYISTYNQLPTTQRKISQDGICMAVVNGKWVNVIFIR